MKPIDSEKYFILMQKLKCISRVSYMSFILQNEPDYPSRILAWLFEKSIDLVDGIIKLHQANLDECGQALIRVLFETYLKYIHFINLMVKTTPGDASLFVIESIVLMREKNCLEQDKTIPGSGFTHMLGDLDSLKNKYNDQENKLMAVLKKAGLFDGENPLKAIRKNGFLLKSVEAVSKKYGKAPEYQIMYRNFSRNVHANDLVEYFLKHEYQIDENDNELRNVAAFDLVLRIFHEMMDHMNHVFSLGMSDELRKIQQEYKTIELNNRST